MTFRSDRLEEISKYVPTDFGQFKTDTTLSITSGKRNVTVRISDGCVEHIGYRIFPDEMRSSDGYPLIADFVERYWLSVTLPLKRQKSVGQQMAEDRFRFLIGDTRSIDQIQQDTTLRLSCYVTDKEVTMAWGDGEKQICRINFPVDHELILGRGMIENDRRLPAEIADFIIKKKEAKDVCHNQSLATDSISSMLIEDGGSYLDCSLKSERYYISASDSGKMEPVFDSDRLKESIMNLFTDYDIEKARDICLDIRHKTFGFNEQIIHTTVSRFVAYSLESGCKPYVGIVSIDRNDEGVADVLVIMRNWQVGYNHILRVSVPVESIATGSGIATARLNAFVPSSNVKNLFKN